MMLLSEFKRRYEKELNKGNISRKTLEKQLDPYSYNFDDTGDINEIKRRLNNKRGIAISDKLGKGTRKIAKESIREWTGGTAYQNSKLMQDSTSNLPKYMRRNGERVNTAIEKDMNRRRHEARKLSKQKQNNPNPISKQAQERRKKVAEMLRNDTYTPTTNTPTTQTVSNATSTTSTSIPKTEPKVTANTYAPSGNDVKKTAQSVGNNGKRKYTKTMMDYWNDLSKGKKAAVALGTVGTLGAVGYGGYKLMNRNNKENRK